MTRVLKISRLKSGNRAESSNGLAWNLTGLPTNTRCRIVDRDVSAGARGPQSVRTT